MYTPGLHDGGNGFRLDVAESPECIQCSSWDCANLRGDIQQPRLFSENYTVLHSHVGGKKRENILTFDQSKTSMDP